ncbi:MAG: DNA repair protein RecO [Deltaproteobacteria bacterium]|nr:DNA repair protein RecO [Deltaproteobacteria bacterium]MBW2540815.1 DNA repair protein RecO [Deltaproteobacteria bacterium]
MTSIRTEALILRSVDFGESDRILHLLVPEIGRLPAIAKGARRSVRRFSGTLDLFNHVKIQVDIRRPNALARLDQASLIDPFIAMRSESARFALGCYLLELFDRLAPERGVRSDMQRLFSFALGALRMVAERAPDLRLRTLIELRALDALGLRPEFSRCVRCGSAPEGRGPIGFHVGEGGVLCDLCGAQADAIPRIHRGTLRALEQGLRLDFERLDRLALSGSSLAEAHQLLTRFQRFHLGVELRSESYLDRVLRSPAAG